MNQDKIFAESEADHWFERNQAFLEKGLESDLPLCLIDTYHLQPKKVLEVGAANGYRLAAIYRKYQAEVVAIEPSPKAIADGQARFPMIRFVRALAHDIPLKTSFDLIIVNFVFHWIDRAHLIQSAAEIDRLLEDGGYLVIGDFYPRNLPRVPYHHLRGGGVFIYKQDYAAIFTATGLYQSIGLLTGQHASKQLVGSVAEDERIGVVLLQKRLKDYYVERLFPTR